MPLNLPNLDDRSYNDLVKEALAMIPGEAAAWTNHNPSDPGITLVELFAYLTEMLLYRVNRITEANQQAFLKLINGPQWQPDPGKTLEQQMRETVMALRTPYRAVTAADFERLSREADPQVVRARCLPRRNLASGYADAALVDVPGYVSLLILADKQAEPHKINQIVKKYLDDRRLLTTQVEVASPWYFKFGIELTIGLKADMEAVTDRGISLDISFKTDLNAQIFSDGLKTAFANNNIIFSTSPGIRMLNINSEWLVSDEATNQQYIIRNEKESLNVYEDTARITVIKAIKNFYDPWAGGEAGNGWPFGRHAYVSEIYQLLDALPGVDYVTKTLDAQTHQPLPEFSAGSERLLLNAPGDLVGVKLQPDELIDVQNITFNLTIVPKRG